MPGTGLRDDRPQPDERESADGAAAAEPATVAPDPEVVGPRRSWPWGEVAVFVAVTVVAAIMVGRSQGHIPDDAFITFRYARNLANGHGWAYNVGSHTTDAATSTLYTIVLAGAYRLRADMLGNAQVVFVLSIAAAAVLVFTTLRRLGELVAAIAAAVLLAVSPWLTVTLGMEAAPFVAVTAACLAAFVARRGLLTGVLLTVLFALRPEGALLAVVLVAAWWIRDRRFPTRLIVGGLVSGAAWLLVASLVTGHVLPDTLSAKVAQGRSGYWGDWDFLVGLRERSVFFREWFLALGGLAVVGVGWTAVKRRLWTFVLPLLGFALLHLFFYGVVFQVPGYSWYYGLEVFALTVLAAIGVGGVGHAFASHRRLRIVAVAGAFALLGVTVVLAVDEQPRGDSVAHYRHVASWLRTHTPRNASIASTEIGTIGWETDRPMVDYLGLLSADSAHEVEHADFVSWLRREHPDYWLVHRPAWSFEAPAMTTDYFHDHYVRTRLLRARTNDGAPVDFEVYRWSVRPRGGG